MATERRRQQLLLAGLTIVLGIVLYRVWPMSAPSAGPAPASNQQSARSAAAGGSQPAAPSATASDVHLDALDSERPKPGQAARDLFRFKPKAPPPPPRVVVPIAPVAPEVPVPTGPPPPPPVPPITLKFIGVMESPAQSQKIAVLSDGRGSPFYGKEGEIVEGRYRILKIGVESIEIAYADGRGRQTIRLSGQ
jgi:hypothetical protein